MTKKVSNEPVDLLVVRQYTLYGIRVLVRIDRREKTVSLVEWDDRKDDYKPKDWRFQDRELEYMDGWRAIMRAMEYAVTEAKKELEKFKEEDIEKLVNIFVHLDKVKLEDEK